MSKHKKHIYLLILSFLIFIIYFNFHSIMARVDRFDSPKNPSFETTLPKPPLEPSIITDDGTILAYSTPVYKVMIDGNYVKLCKYHNECHFIDILSDIVQFNKKEVYYHANMYNYTVLSYDVNKSTAQKLLWLSNQISPLYNYKTERFLKPILIETSGVKRIYPYKDLLTPVIGHTIKREKNQLTIPQGVMGIERIAQHSAQKIKTTINLKKQKELERKVDDIKDEYSAKEVLGITIDLKSGAIKALASSLR